MRNELPDAVRRRNSGESLPMAAIDWAILSLYCVFVLAAGVALAPRGEQSLAWYARPVSFATIFVSGTLLLSLLFW
jgi:hypothetical protein